MQDKSTMSIEALAVHIDYLRLDMREVSSKMATKEDVQKIAARMENFVTTDRFDALEKKVTEGTLGNSVDRLLTRITKMASAATAVAALVALITAIVHFADKIKALI